MTKAVNAWAIWHPAQGLLLHSVHANKPGAWVMLNLGRPEDMRTAGDFEALGFRAVRVRIKHEEP